MDHGTAGRERTFLAELTSGQRARITGIPADRALGRRLADLGLPIGSVVRITHRHGGGVVVAGRDQRLALSRDLAGRIAVEPLHEVEAAE